MGRSPNIRNRSSKPAVPASQCKFVDPDSHLILQTVERLMTARDMTYVDLAYRTKTPPSTMYALLHPASSGYGPLKINVIRKFAEGLDVPIAELLSALTPRLSE